MKRVEHESYFLLRWFHPEKKDDVRYAGDARHASYRSSSNPRIWCVEFCLDHAYRFEKRSDARRTVRSPAFDTLRTKGYYWEIIEVEEEVVRTFKTTIVVSDAPPLVTLARSAS